MKGIFVLIPRQIVRLSFLNRLSLKFLFIGRLSLSFSPIYLKIFTYTANHKVLTSIVKLRGKTRDNSKRCEFEVCTIGSLVPLQLR